jgi:hypothetical protein
LLEKKVLRLGIREITKMAGTKSGGIKARDSNKKRWGEDYYKRIGKSGGAVKGVKKGFALDPGKAVLAGAVGGRISRRNGLHTTPVDKKAYKKAVKKLNRARNDYQPQTLVQAVKAAITRLNQQG